MKMDLLMDFSIQSTTFGNMVEMEIGEDIFLWRKFAFKQNFNGPKEVLYSLWDFCGLTHNHIIKILREPSLVDALPLTWGL